MQEDNDARVAIVTGAAGLLGRKYVAVLEGRGYRVVGVDLQAGGLAGLAAHGTLTMNCDLTDRPAVENLVETCLSRLGRIDVLVNNAGGPIVARKASTDLSVQEFWEVLNANLLSAWLASICCLPNMTRRGWGRIVNIASMSAYTGIPEGMTAYVAAKAGVIGLTRGLARELGSRDITVNAIAPGVIHGGGSRSIHSPAEYETLLANAESHQALSKKLVPSDVAGAVAFLASEDAGAMTGQVLSVDGGWVFH